MSAPSYDEAVAATPTSSNAVQGLQRDINQLAPLAQSYHSLPQAPPEATYKSPNSSQPDEGAVLNFAHFMGGILNQVGNIAETAGGWLKDQTVNLATAPIRYGASLAHGILDNESLDGINMVSGQLDQIQTNLMTKYKAGQISKEEYTRSLNDLSQEWDNLSRQSTALTNRFSNDYQEAKQATIDTSAALLTVLTGGFGRGATATITTGGIVSAEARTAGSYLASAGAKVFFGSTEDALKSVAAHPKLFEALAPGVKSALEQSVAEVVATGAKMSSGQIARAAAVNLALKYPLTYWYAQSTATDLYHELDQAKYGEATRTAAFNAALLLSGGPIGYALKWGGKGVKAVVDRMFLRSSFIDELSKGIGTGEADGLWKTVNELPHPERLKFFQDGKLVTLSREEAQKRLVANLSALEATNMAATGKDPVAAAWRVLRGMAGYEGISMKNFTTEDALVNMNNFAEAQRAADEAGKAAGKRITVGRLDTRDLEEISAGLTASDKAVEGLPATTDAASAAAMKGAPDFLQPSGATQSSGFTRSAQATAITSTSDLKLPPGYTMDKFGIIYNAKGDELTTGQIQDILQNARGEGYLSEFEKASREGDQATMDRIVAEHPGDQRLRVPESEKQWFTAQRLQTWEQLKTANPNKAWAHNENFDRQVKALIQKYDHPNELDQAIRSIKAQFKVEGLPTGITDTLAQMGYLPIKPVNLEAPFTEGTGKIGSSFAAANSDLFTKAVQPVPVLSWMGGMLSKAGLSPFASSERVYQLFNDNLARNLKASGVVPELLGESSADTTDTLIKKLSSYMHNPTVRNLTAGGPMTDLRMLTTKDIAAATGVTKSEALAVQDAIARSFLQVPLAARGLGDRLVDLAYGLRGTAALERRYLRIQGALRFSWNPFFQYLRLTPKTELLSEFEGGGFIKSVFTGRLGELGPIRSALREGGFLDSKGSFGNVVSGEGVDFAGSMGRNLNHKLLPAQENSIAGLVDAQASRMGLDWKTYVSTSPDQVRDTVQMIAQYDRRSQVLNSPLMRTLNIAVFPLRFDTKVATIMARSLARQPLSTQVAVLKGVMSFHDWINSDQGRAWYAQNSDAIGLFNYITPIAHLSEVFDALLPGHDHSLGNFGELGGLPFGFIPQLLDAEGLTHFNQAGVNPKSGELYTQYLPKTTRGQLAIVIQDFLSSLFSYPGATAGLPSKTKITRGIAEGITGAKDGDFTIVPPKPTAESLSYQQALQRMGVVSQPGGPTSAPAPTTSQRVPVLRTPTPAASASNRVTTTRRKKKSDFRPQLLPGQTQLGQL